jgi:dTMP kinase
MGQLIVLDGLDGSGKETQTLLLEKALLQSGKKVRMISFPMYDSVGATFVKEYLGGRFGEDPEAVNAYAASSFFAMDRFYSYRTDWKKDLDDPEVTVLANRYTSANAVHQLSKLPKEKWDSFLSWLWEYEFSLLGLPRPDRVIYLELKPQISRRLIAARSAQTGRAQDIHERDPHHLENSYEAALYASQALGWDRVQCYCGEEMRTREEIHKQICRLLGLEK